MKKKPPETFYWLTRDRNSSFVAVRDLGFVKLISLCYNDWVEFEPALWLKPGQCMKVKHIHYKDGYRWKIVGRRRTPKEK